jgi:hypothetical protein
MENLDLIILTVVVVVAFVIFITSTFKELNQMTHEPYQAEKVTGYSRAALFRVLGEMFEDDTIPEKHRVAFKSTLQRTISDMESNGVYFDDEEKNHQGENKSEDMSDKVSKEADKLP